MLAAALVTPAYAGGELKCLELTRIAADSLDLSAADKEWCRVFGIAADRETASNNSGKPATIGHAALKKLIETYLRKYPDDASKPLAAQTILAIAELVGGP